MLAYVVDVSTFLNSEKGYKTFKYCISNYEQAAGSVLSKQNTQHLVIYNKGTNIDFQKCMKLKVQGIWLQIKNMEMIEHNYKLLLAKLKKLSYLYRCRSFRLLSRVKYAKTDLSANVWDVAIVLPKLPVPKVQEMKIESLTAALFGINTFIVFTIMTSVLLMAFGD